jgi:hypothetical protein
MLHFDPTVPGGLVSRFVTTARVLRLLVSGDSTLCARVRRAVRRA